jgi:hypothetical protein
MVPDEEYDMIPLFAPVTSTFCEPEFKTKFGTIMLIAGAK